MSLTNPYMKCYSCSHIGVTGTTRIYTMKRQTEPEEIWEARVGIAIMGYTNHDNRVDNPFDHRWRDNYAVGYGTTEEKAIEALRLNAKKTSDSLWAE